MKILLCLVLAGCGGAKFPCLGSVCADGGFDLGADLAPVSMPGPSLDMLPAFYPDLARPGPDMVPIVSGGPKRVFVTNTAYSPTVLRTVCQDSADAATLGGTWKPWLSDSSGDAIDRIAGTGPWKLLTGDVAFNNHAQLATQPLVPINITELGTELLIGSYIWTGTTNGGRATHVDCDNWTSAAHNSTTGQLPTLTNDPSGWTDDQELGCNYQEHVYCFEQ